MKLIRDPGVIRAEFEIWLVGTQRKTRFFYLSPLEFSILSTNDLPLLLQLINTNALHSCHNQAIKKLMIIKGEQILSFIRQELADGNFSQLLTSKLVAIFVKTKCIPREIRWQLAAQCY